LLGAALEDLRRLRTIAAVLTRHGFREFADRLSAFAAPGRSTLTLVRPEEFAQGAGEQSRLTVQERFCRVLEDLGPTFIKLGQVLSTRHDLLPVAFIEALSRLQDSVEPLPFSAIQGQIEAGLGRPLAEVFRSVEPMAMAAASIAQVHAAVLLDGSPVVVKVQRPGTATTIASDLDVLRGLARLIDATIEEARGYDPRGIVTQFERSLQQELDYLHEAHNLEEMRNNFKEFDWLVIPQTFPAATCRTVLTLARIEGTKLRDLPADSPHRAAITERIIQAAYKMLFQDGLFHADPHPGNVFVLDDGRLALIDFGMVGRVSEGMRETLIQLALGITTRDSAGLARLLYRLGTAGVRINLHEFCREIEELIDKYLGLTLSRLDTRSLVADLFEAALRYGIRVPPAYALMIKASATIEGVVRGLSPDLDILAATKPYAQQLLAERYGPQELSVRLLRAGLSLGGVLQDLPLEAEQILMDLESGRLSVHVESEAIRTLGDKLNALGTRVFLGLIAGAALVSTTLLLVRFPVEVFGPRGVEAAAWAIGVLVVLGASWVVGLFVTSAAWHLLSTRYPKLRLAFLVRSLRWLFARREPATREPPAPTRPLRERDADPLRPPEEPHGRG
jgi:ubiquinone biosynthesis protein